MRPRPTQHDGSGAFRRHRQERAARRHRQASCPAPSRVRLRTSNWRVASSDKRKSPLTTVSRSIFAIRQAADFAPAASGRFLRIHPPGGDPALHPSLDEELEKQTLFAGLDGDPVAFFDDEAGAAGVDGLEEVGQVAGVRLGMDEREHLLFIASRGNLFQACDKGLDGIRLPALAAPRQRGRTNNRTTAVRSLGNMGRSRNSILDTRRAASRHPTVRYVPISRNQPAVTGFWDEWVNQVRACAPTTPVA